MTTPDARRRGYTLVEILTVIFVIAILMALLLPAVQAARESARRARCASQLRDIGLAIHQHADARGTFPAGSGQPTRASFLVQILPYLEQRALYDSMNLERNDYYSVMIGANTTALVSLPSIYLCPSDSWRKPIANLSSNYAGNAGFSIIDGAGVFIGRPLGPPDLADGLSQTVGAAEWIVGPGRSDRGHRLGSVYTLTQPLPPDDLGAFVRLCDALPPDGVRLHRAFKGIEWIIGVNGASLYNHALAPNRPSCVSSTSIDAFTAGSFHGGGAYTLTMDGGVHFVKETIDPHVWSALGTRAGGEAITGDALE